ncbi:Protein of unknown function (DUF732) [Mycolicibacterium chubuense NBB4]|uniref:DUF732 domain-containing protein n=1 Tax=Mycolicibacterium chubuense (strain NBB4) TaxID=710421 RepID=I4BES0_MYCCN|nr:DUF732 domain-containing protein [Mycolicibacterium chubuense]AFM15777.1 Protein of unknown function (DUF732) [Mycolicibacterium chubuense NBB4]
MTRTRRTVAVAMVAAGLSVFGSAAYAHADTTPDEKFTAAVTALGIPLAPNTDVPAVGHRVCDMLTAALKANAVNPVPAVRGVVTTLENTGMKREQAGGLVKASVAVYCPQHGRFVGR